MGIQITEVFHIDSTLTVPGVQVSETALLWTAVVFVGFGHLF